MTFFKFIFIYGCLFISSYINSFSKAINITFHFNVPAGSISYSNNFKTISFNNYKASIKLEEGNYNFVFSNPNNNSIYKKLSIFNSKDYIINFPTKKNINGKILDKNFKPIFNSKIEIKNKNKKLITTSNKFGDFEIPLTKGTTLIKISKPGYHSKIIIRNFKYSNHSDKIILDKYYYSIFGTTINDVYPVENSFVYLFSENGSLLKKNKTNINGNFSITNISSKNCYIFIPETKKFKSYKSKPFKIKNSIQHFHINLKKR